MGSALGPYRDVTWMMMLRSLGAEQMYRRRMGAMISPPDAVRFLLHDAAFPRSVEYCLIDISRWLLELPHQQKPMAASAAVQRHVDGIDLREVDPIVLNEFVDQLQVRLGTLHDRVAETYFLSAELADARP